MLDTRDLRRIKQWVCGKWTTYTKAIAKMVWHIIFMGASPAIGLQQVLKRHRGQESAKSVRVVLEYQLAYKIFADRWGIT